MIHARKPFGRGGAGQQLRERELCELTGVSRPSLREALRVLEAEGLITTVPHRGPVVTALSAAEVSQLYDLRRVLELMAVREFARLRRPGDIAVLQDAIRRLNQVQRAGTPFEILRVSTDLYRAIAVGSGNPDLAETLRGLHNRIALIRYISLHRRDGIPRSFGALRALADAIIAGKEVEAERHRAEMLDSAAASDRLVVEAGYQLPAAGHAEVG